MNAVQVRLISDDPDWLQERSAQLAPVEDIVVTARQKLSEVDAAATPAVLLIDAGPSPAETLASLGSLTGSGRGWVTVLLLRPGADPRDNYPQAALHGVRVVLAADCRLPDLAEAVYSSSAYLPSPTAAAQSAVVADARMITVFGTKGGVGKTTLAVNLGVAFALRGLRTALLDLHLDWGNAATHLRLTAPRPFSDLMAESARLDGDLLLSFMARHDSGLRVLCAPPRPEMAEFVTPAHVEAVMGVARQSFDAVVVDTPPAFPETLQPALDHASNVLLLTQPDVPALRNTRACLRIMEMLRVPRARIHVVLTRTGRGQGVRQADVEATLAVPVWAAVPADEPTARRTAAEGIPAMTLMPASRLARSVDTMARLLVPGGGTARLTQPRRSPLLALARAAKG